MIETTQQLKSSSLFKRKIDEHPYKELYKAECERVIAYFKENDYSIQSVYYYFNNFINNNITDDLLERCLKLRKTKAQTLDKYILLFGEDEAHKRWRSYCNKQALTNTFEYKQEKYGMDENDFANYNKSRAVTLELCKKRHGEIEGQRIFEGYCYKQKTAGNTLEYFKEKYGEIEGKLEYDKVCAKKAQTLLNFKMRYGEIDGVIRYEQYVSNSVRRGAKGYSQISLNLFWDIFDNMLTKKERDYCYFAEHKHEYFLTNGVGHYKYDFVILNLKYCIEFNGDIFHGNPILFNENNCPNPFDKKLTAKQMWEKDKTKNQFLMDKGFVLDVVWEKDYVDNPEKVKQKIIGTLNACRHK